MITTCFGGIRHGIKRQKRLWIMVGLLCALIAVAIPVLNITMGWNLHKLIRQTYARIHASITLPLLSHRDPRLGDEVAMPEDSQIVGGDLEKERHKVILFVGHFTPCTLGSVPLLQIVQKAHKNMQIVIVSTSPTTVVEQTYLNFEEEQFVWVSDSDRNYANKLNVFFYPRVYLVDEQSRVRYIQPYHIGCQQALIEAVSHLSEEVR